MPTPGSSGLTPDPETRPRVQRVLDAALRAGHEGIFVLDADSRVRDLNPAAERLSGYSAAEAIGQGYMELMVPPERRAQDESVRRLVAELPADGSSLSLRRVYRRKDGSHFHADCRLVKLTDGSGDKVIFIRDLAEEDRFRQGLKTVFEASADGIVLTDLDGRVSDCNQRALDLAGLSKEELVGRPVNSLLAREEDRAECRAAFQALREHGSHPVLGHWVQRSLRRAGQDFPGEFHLVTLGEAQPPQAILFLRDRSREQAKLDAALASLAFFETIVKNSMGLMGLFDLEGKALYLSPSVKAILGYEVQALIGQSPQILLHPEQRVQAAADLQRLGSGELPFVEAVRRYLCQDGRYKRLRVRYSRLGPESPVPGILMHAEDVEAGLQAEEQLRKSESLHRSIVEYSWDLLAVVGPDGRIEQASPSMVAALEEPMESLLGRGLARLVVPEERPRLEAALALALARREGGQDQDLRLQVPGGSRLFEVRLRHLGEDRDGRVLFKARDIQQERDTQAQVMHYQRLAVFGQLAAGFAHEVRNPLAGILGAAQLAKRRAGVGQDAHEQLDVVLRQAERLRGLMEDILLHAKGPRVAPVLADPGAVLERAVESALQQFGPDRSRLRVELEIQSGRARVRVTEERLQRLLQNLVLNALQALPASQGRLSASSELRGGEVLLRIADNGPGLNGEALLRAFEPFYTTKATGSGLGLWIAQSLSQEMGGRLSHSAVQPHGAAFTLALPVAEDP